MKSLRSHHTVSLFIRLKMAGLLLLATTVCVLGQEISGEGYQFRIGSNLRIQYKTTQSGWYDIHDTTVVRYAIAKNSQGRLEIYAISTDNARNVIYRFVENGSGGWTRPEQVGDFTATTRQLAVGAAGDGRLCVVARAGRDGSHMAYTFPPTGGSWTVIRSLDEVPGVQITEADFNSTRIQLTNPVVSCLPSTHEFARGHCTVRHVSNPEGWVRGKASLNTRSGEFKMILGLETDWTSHGVSGTMRVTLKDSQDRALAEIRMEKPMGIPGKFRKARIEEFEFAKSIPVRLASRTVALEVDVEYTGSVLAPGGFSLEEIEAAIKVIAFAVGGGSPNE